MHLWYFKDNVWKMSRVISYDHGPAPFINNRREVVLDQSDLQRLAGIYSSAKAEATITVENNRLRLTMGDFQVIMVPESSSTFFVKERNLNFDFILDGSKVKKLLVYENGNVVDELSKL
jgi:activator of HSP90 ATPase